MDAWLNASFDISFMLYNQTLIWERERERELYIPTMNYKCMYFFP